MKKMFLSLLSSLRRFGGRPQRGQSPALHPHSLPLIKGEIKEGVKRLGIIIYLILLVFSFVFYAKGVNAKTVTSGDFRMTYDETTFLKGGTNLAPGDHPHWLFSIENLGSSSKAFDLLVAGDGASSYLANQLNLLIKEGGNVIYADTIAHLKDNQATVDSLAAFTGKTYELTISMPASLDNSYQGTSASPIDFTFGFPGTLALGGGRTTFAFGAGGAAGGAVAGETTNQNENINQNANQNQNENGSVKGETEEAAKTKCWVWWVVLLAAGVLIIIHYFVIWNRELTLWWLTPLVIAVLAEIIDIIAHRYLEKTVYCNWLWLMLLGELIVSGFIYWYFKGREVDEDEEEL